MATPHTTPIVTGIIVSGTRGMAEQVKCGLLNLENSEGSSEDTWSSTEEQEDINWDWEDETGELT